MNRPEDRPAAEGLERPIGVWRAIRELGDYKLKDALWPEVIGGLLLGVGGAVLIIRSTTVAERVSVMGDVLPLAGVLLAVTFAALAFVVSIPSGEYLRMLGETRGGGMRLFLTPFLVAIGVQIALVLLALAYRIFADDVAVWIEHAVFGVGSFMLVFTLLDIAGLARQLVQHGLLRAADAALAADEQAKQQGQVRRLPERHR